MALSERDGCVSALVAAGEAAPPLLMIVFRQKYPRRSECAYA
jgi:hypothetical protein